MTLNESLIPAPIRGYNDGLISPEASMQLSRNMTWEEGVWRRRRGYVIRRNQGSSTASYVERIPVDDSNGALYAAFMAGETIYRDAASPVSLEASFNDPLTTKVKPQWVHMLGRAVWTEGAKTRILIHDGSNVIIKEPLPDGPNNGTDGVTISAVSGGSMTDAGWILRIRYYDEDTGTYGGPNDRTGSSDLTVTTSGSNNTIRVNGSAVSPPSRVSHVQFQFAQTTDTPSGFEIVEYSGSTLIPIATFTGGNIDITADPATGLSFEFRTDGLQTVYRHSNFPTHHFNAHYRGRYFMAANDSTWLIWSETDNPEHMYHDTSDPGGASSFNSLRGDGLVDSLSSPCTGLAANELVLLFGQRNGIVMCEGDWQPQFNDDGEFVRRNAHTTPSTQGTTGLISPSVAVVDQEIYFWGEGSQPKVFAQGGVVDLRSENIRRTLAKADADYEGLYHVAYDPRTDLVLFAFTSTDTTGPDGVCDTVLAWHRKKQVWCSPWDLHVTALTLHRLTTDAGENRGARILAGSPYGQIKELFYKDGDGWSAANDPESVAITPDSATTTSVDVTGSGWTSNQWRGFALVLVDNDTGYVYTREIQSNDGDTINWEGALTVPAGGWTVYIGGIADTGHIIEINGLDGVLRYVTIMLDDLRAREE